MWQFTTYTGDGILGQNVGLMLGTGLLASVALGACLLIINFASKAEAEHIHLTSELMYRELLN